MLCGGLLLEVTVIYIHPERFHIKINICTHTTHTHTPHTRVYIHHTLISTNDMADRNGATESVKVKSRTVFFFPHVHCSRRYCASAVTYSGTCIMRLCIKQLPLFRDNSFYLQLFTNVTICPFIKHPPGLSDHFFLLSMVGETPNTGFTVLLFWMRQIHVTSFYGQFTFHPIHNQPTFLATYCQKGQRIMNAFTQPSSSLTAPPFPVQIYRHGSLVVLWRKLTVV